MEFFIVESAVKLPTHVVELTKRVGVVERWIGEDEVGLYKIRGQVSNLDIPLLRPRRATLRLEPLRASRLPRT